MHAMNIQGVAIIETELTPTVGGAKSYPIVDLLN